MAPRWTYTEANASRWRPLFDDLIDGDYQLVIGARHNPLVGPEDLSFQAVDGLPDLVPPRVGKRHVVAAVETARGVALGLSVA